MARSTQSKVLVDSRTTTGRDYFNLPDVPTVVAVFVELVSGTATISIEISDDNPKFDPNPTYIPIQTLTETSLVVISIPAAVIAVNTLAISGEINVSYRFTAGENYLNTPIQIFNNATLLPAPLSVTGTLTTTAPGSTSRLYGPAQPSTSAATVYTVPGSTSATISAIHVANTTGTAATFTASIGADAAATRFFSAYSIAANSYLHQALDFKLAATTIVQMFQGTSGALTVILSGNQV